MHSTPPLTPQQAYALLLRLTPAQARALAHIATGHQRGIPTQTMRVLLRLGLVEVRREYRVMRLPAEVQRYRLPGAVYAAWQAWKDGRVLE